MGTGWCVRRYLKEDWKPSWRVWVGYPLVSVVFAPLLFGCYAGFGVSILVGLTFHWCVKIFSDMLT